MSELLASKSASNSNYIRVPGTYKYNVEPDVYRYNLKAARGFSPITGTWLIDYVELYLDRNETTGPAAGNLVLELREGTPDGTLLETIGTYNRVSVGLSPGWHTFTFAGTTVINSDTTYYLVLADPAGSEGVPGLFDDDLVQWMGGFGEGQSWYKWDVISWIYNSNMSLSYTVYGSSALPGKPTNPSPSHEASDITLDQSPLSWDASSPVADTYEIYFREQGEDWDLIGVAQAGIEYILDFGTLDYSITYEWRVDATNAYGTTTGDTWTFDSITFNYILPGASGGGGGGGGGGGSGEESSPTGENNMITLRRLVAAANDKIWYEDI